MGSWYTSFQSVKELAVAGVQFSTSKVCVCLEHTLRREVLYVLIERAVLLRCGVDESRWLGQGESYEVFALPAHRQPPR